MPEKKGARLDFDERWEIEDMLKESSPFCQVVLRYFLKNLQSA